MVKNENRSIRHRKYVMEILSGNMKHEREFAKECRSICYALIRRKNFCLINRDDLVYSREDFFQDTFADMWEALDTYNPEYAFSTWYGTICKNKYYKFLQRRKENSSLSDENTCLEVDTKYAHEDAAIIYMKQNPQAWNKLMQELEGINPKYRRAIELHYLKGYSVKQIALFLQTKETTVNNWLNRGRKKLAAFCEKEQLKEDLYFEMAA